MLKNFWKNNAHFADLFNAALFDGQPVLDPAVLQEADTNLSVVVLNEGQEQNFQREFDVVKKTVHGTDYVLFVLENQQNIHYAMPVRQMFNEALPITMNIQPSHFKMKKKASMHPAQNISQNSEKLTGCIPLSACASIMGMPNGMVRSLSRTCCNFRII